jgi:hypothetical protein
MPVHVFSGMVGMARRAVPGRGVAGGTNIRATLAFTGTALRPARFPPDFMFQVAARWSQFATLKRGQNVKHLPHAASENGAIAPRAQVRLLLKFLLNSS